MLVVVFGLEGNVNDNDDYVDYGGCVVCGKGVDFVVDGLMMVVVMFAWLYVLFFVRWHVWACCCED